MRILTGGDDEMHLRRLVLDQKGQGLVYRSGINRVIVVQDEDGMVWETGNLNSNRFPEVWLSVRGKTTRQRVLGLADSITG